MTVSVRIDQIIHVNKRMESYGIFLSNIDEVKGEKLNELIKE